MKEKLLLLVLILSLGFSVAQCPGCGQYGNNGEYWIMWFVMIVVMILIIIFIVWALRRNDYERERGMGPVRRRIENY